MGVEAIPHGSRMAEETTDYSLYGSRAMRQVVFAAFVVIVSLTVLPVCGVERGRENEGRSASRQPRGGAWSERSHQGGRAHGNYAQPASEHGAGARRSATELGIYAMPLP